MKYPGFHTGFILCIFCTFLGFPAESAVVESELTPATGDVGESELAPTAGHARGWEQRGGGCEDELAVSHCDEAITAGCDKNDALSWKCRRSCHLCVVDGNQREWSDDSERASKCKDMIPQCNVYANPIICCAIKPLANATCQRSCRFCYDMNTIPVVSGLVPIPVGGSGSPAGVETPVVYQDPCNPSAPPTASGTPGGIGGGGSGGSGNGEGAGSSIPGAPGGLPGGGSPIPGGGSSQGPIPSSPIG